MSLAIEWKVNKDYRKAQTNFVITQMSRVERIIGLGSHLPLDPMDNEELLQHCKLTDEVWTKERCLKWIDDKLGIKTRHTARYRENNSASTSFRPAEGCKNSELCAQAIRNAAQNANIELTELGPLCSSPSPSPLTTLKR